MKGRNFELDKELCRAQLNRGSERTHVLIVVNADKPTRVIGLVQNGHGDTRAETLSGGTTDGVFQAASHDVSRRTVRPRPQRQTPSRNGVTLSGSPPGGGVNRLLERRGIPQEAKAAGKASREADVGTVRCKWAEGVTLHTLCAHDSS